MSFDGQPALYGVIGHPVKHSLSPRIHEFWYEKHQKHACYLALDLLEASPTEDIRALGRAGFSGLNVTLPHKLSALEAAAEISDAAMKIGAANTLRNGQTDQGSPAWFADNTDWSGFLWSLDRWIPDLTEKALLIGAGGAARAVAYALGQRGVRLSILNRTPEKARALADHMNLAVDEISTLDQIEVLAGNFPLVINTVSLGHSGGRIELPTTNSGYFIDISYGAAASETLNAARASGWKTEDGLPMLVGQAADAFNIWFGETPDREAALKACRDWTR